MNIIQVAYLWEIWGSLARTGLLFAANMVTSKKECNLSYLGLGAFPAPNSEKQRNLFSDISWTLSLSAHQKWFSCLLTVEFESLTVKTPELAVLQFLLSIVNLFNQISGLLTWAGTKLVTLSSGLHEVATCLLSPKMWMLHTDKIPLLVLTTIVLLVV